MRARGIEFVQYVQMVASATACAVVFGLSAFVLLCPFGFESELSEVLATSFIWLDGLALLAVFYDIFFLKAGS